MSTVLEQPQQAETPKRSASRRLSDGERLAIVARYTETNSIIQTANEFNINRATVRSVVNAARDYTNTQRDDWRSSLRKKAVTALSSGLDCNDDPYKRGELGNKALIGLGEFRGEGANVNIATFISSAPVGALDDYLTTSQVLNVTPEPQQVVLDTNNVSDTALIKS